MRLQLIYMKIYKIKTNQLNLGQKSTEQISSVIREEFSF
ncbi:unnamed protein product [Schistosoma curassoni]|uniref:Sporulation protein n=1 Tax=Schistosoma curassoni TaxID=6186 RepID=A0A183KZZ7_9TREM|nr:unnamed protein product [Schistosoma curassoni]